MQKPLDTRGSRANDVGSARPDKEQADGTHASSYRTGPFARGVLRPRNVYAAITLMWQSSNLSDHALYATGTTGRMLRDELDMLVFFTDPMQP